LYETESNWISTAIYYPLLQKFSEKFNMNTETRFIEGHCLCKKYSFQIQSEFIKFGFASCHCSVCRLAHASPVVLWSGIKSENSHHFLVKENPADGHTIPKETLSKFRSSPQCTRYFCGTCGTHLFIEYDRSTSSEAVKCPWEGEIHFPSALLDEDSVALLEEVTDAFSFSLFILLFSLLLLFRP
jgi:hypothetical protein